MNDVMVDIETTGTDPSHAAIIQIAAVRFDYATMQIGPAFRASLAIAEGRYWDPGTHEWWHHPNRINVLAKIMAEAQDPKLVWDEFVWFCRQHDMSTPLRLWAKPVSFEWPFLQSYGKLLGNDLPFHYRYAVDLNSFTRGMANDPGAEPLEKLIPFEGDKHDALEDVFHQVKTALMAKSLLSQKEAAVV